MARAIAVGAEQAPAALLEAHAATPAGFGKLGGDLAVAHQLDVFDRHQRRDLGGEGDLGGRGQAHLTADRLIAHEVEPSGMTVEQLDDYYRPESYSQGLYG